MRCVWNISVGSGYKISVFVHLCSFCVCSYILRAVSSSLRFYLSLLLKFLFICISYQRLNFISVNFALFSRCFFSHFRTRAFTISSSGRRYNCSGPCSVISAHVLVYTLHPHPYPWRRNKTKTKRDWLIVCYARKTGILRIHLICIYILIIMLLLRDSFFFQELQRAKTNSVQLNTISIGELKRWPG